MGRRQQAQAGEACELLQTVRRKGGSVRAAALGGASGARATVAARSEGSSGGAAGPSDLAATVSSRCTEICSVLRLWCRSMTFLP
jgi:hypothetical protein